MYAHLTFFHQGYDLFSELQPLMKLLGGQVNTREYTCLFHNVISDITLMLPSTHGVTLCNRYNSEKERNLIIYSFYRRQGRQIFFFV